MKVLITNPGAIIDQNGNYFPGIEKALDYFQENGNKVVVISVSNPKLQKIKTKYLRHNTSARERMGIKLIENVKSKFNIEVSDILVLGCKRADVALSSNSQAFLLRADYAKSGNENETIYSKDYGVPIGSPITLKAFLQIFLIVEEPWYYKNQISDVTTIYSLINANTVYRAAGTKELELVEKFQSYLKDGDESYREIFLMFFIASLYRIMKEVENVDIWCYYPSSGTGINESLDYFTMKARTLFRVRGKRENFLIRKIAIQKRHKLIKNNRLQEGCHKQFTSLALSEIYGDINDKTICVIDDYTTYGTSCETCRHIFEAFGVKKLIFITLGKFGREYFKYNYNLDGSEYNKLKIKIIGTPEQINGQFNAKATIEFIKSLKNNV